MTLGSRITSSKRSGDEEESSPLLGQRSQARNDSENPQPTEESNSYGSILPSQTKPKNGNGNTPDGSSNSEPNGDKEVKNQGTVDYIKSFKVRIFQFHKTILSLPPFQLCFV